MVHLVQHASIGTSYAGTNVRIGHSGKVRFYDSLTGRIFFNNREFRNNLDYEYLYINDPNENREQNNNNLNRSNNRTWRPVETTVVEYNNAGPPTTPAPDTQFIDQNGVPLKYPLQYSVLQSNLLYKTSKSRTMTFLN